MVANCQDHREPSSAPLRRLPSIRVFCWPPLFSSYSVVDSGAVPTASLRWSLASPPRSSLSSRSVLLSSLSRSRNLRRGCRRKSRLPTSTPSPFASVANTRVVANNPWPPSHHHGWLPPCHPLSLSVLISPASSLPSPRVVLLTDAVNHHQDRRRRWRGLSSSHAFLPSRASLIFFLSALSLSVTSFA